MTRIPGRWYFVDGDTSYRHHMNPRTMASPQPAKGYDSGVGSTARTASTRSAPAPMEWEFGGFIRSQEHHDALDEWSKKTVPIEVLDHLGRTFVVMLQSLQVQERKPTPTTPWRMTYVMKALLLREVPSA